MAQLEPLKADIAAAGAELTYIAAEKTEWDVQAGEVSRERIPFPIPFARRGRTATRANGLYHGLGIDALNIAHPATIVIDQQRSVRYIYRGDNQHDRAPMEPVLGRRPRCAANCDGTAKVMLDHDQQVFSCEIQGHHEEVGSPVVDCSACRRGPGPELFANRHSTEDETRHNDFYFSSLWVIPSRASHRCGSHRRQDAASRRSYH